MVEMVYLTKLDDDRYVVKFECNCNDLHKLFKVVEPPTRNCYMYTNSIYPEGWDKSDTDIYKYCADTQCSANKQREERNG